MDALLVDRGPLCASLVRYPPYLNFFSTAEKLEIEDVPFTSARPNPTRREALAYYRGVVRYFGLDVRTYHEVEALARDTKGGSPSFRVRIRVDGGLRSEVRAGAVVFAIGGFHHPNMLGIPGETPPRVSHFYSEAHPYWNQDVLVVGGGNSAVEASLELFRTGARVTLVHFGKDLDGGVKPWLLPDIRNRFASGEIAVHWEHRLVALGAGWARLRAERTHAIVDVPNDRVLALTGWRSDPALLRAVGVPVDEHTGIPAHDPETMETPVPGVFVAGVLAAGHDANRIFIENGREHGRRIIDHLG